MIGFFTTILKFDNHGEKSGWTYIAVPAAIATQIKPGNKISFRVKGKLDSHFIRQTALLPMGDGDFILPLNAALRKALAKNRGAEVLVQLEEDKEPYTLNQHFMECLEDEPPALEFFNTLAPSHQRYFSKWIDAAKTPQTLTKRIAMAVTALSKKMNYGEMIRSSKKITE